MGNEADAPNQQWLYDRIEEVVREEGRVALTHNYLNHHWEDVERAIWDLLKRGFGVQPKVDRDDQLFLIVGDLAGGETTFFQLPEEENTE